MKCVKDTNPKFRSQGIFTSVTTTQFEEQRPFPLSWKAHLSPSPIETHPPKGSRPYSACRRPCLLPDGKRRVNRGPQHTFVCTWRPPFSTVPAQASPAGLSAACSAIPRALGLSTTWHYPWVPGTRLLRHRTGVCFSLTRNFPKWIPKSTPYHQSQIPPFLYPHQPWVLSTFF